jgi:LPXTG-motif cell wall-anchored protein
VHLGYDQFRITIPWLEDHTLTGDDTAQKPGPYTLQFLSTTHKFSAQETVEIMYEAAVEPTATIGESNDTNLFNTVTLSWVTPHDIFSGQEDRVVTKTYGIGLIKEDATTRENLKDAVFKIYSDESHTTPVYVIPTKVQGVYIVDSLKCPSQGISGTAMEDARELYGTKTDADRERLLNYLGGDLSKQNNQVVSQVNGRLVILGLKDGDYYLVETNPPKGYNGLKSHQKITVDGSTSIFTIFADKTTGEVADIQQDDGIHSEINYDLSTIIVQNSKGEELPSTGGEGTFWMITIGALLAIGFAIFLITHKKMSVYTD